MRIKRRLGVAYLLYYSRLIAFMSIFWYELFQGAVYMYVV